MTVVEMTQDAARRLHEAQMVRGQAYLEGLAGPLQHAGLALAIGLGACLNAILLYRGLRTRGIYRPQPGWPIFMLRLALALVALSAVLWLAAGSADYWLAAS